MLVYIQSILKFGGIAAMNSMARGKHRVQLELESARNEKFKSCLEDGYTAEEANQIASAYFIVASDMLAKNQGNMNCAKQTLLDASIGELR